MTIRWILGSALVASGLAACGGEVTTANTGGAAGTSTGGGGETGSTTSSSSSSGSTSTTTSSSSSSSSSSGGACTGPCCPASSCKAKDLSCIGLVDNTGLTKFGLRMSELTLAAPTALKTGIVAGILGGAVAPANPGCNLIGVATFNWLLQFDTAAAALKTGGAKPVADANSGYAFVDEMVQGKHIQPVTFGGVTPGANGSFSVAQGLDLIMPIYLDAAGTSVLILPLKGARFTMGTLSASHNCIGHYNGEGLEPANSCLPDATNHAFITGAKLGGMITLEDADTITINSLAQSLCVLLSQNTAMYGEKNALGVTVCKRTNGVINFQGDTCSMAGSTCKDAVVLSGDFAASSIQINN